MGTAVRATYLEQNVLDHRTALHDAAESGEVDLARVLIEAGADLGALDPEGNTPLLLAKKSGQTDIIRLIFSSAH